MSSCNSLSPWNDNSAFLFSSASFGRFGVSTPQPRSEQARVLHVQSLRPITSVLCIALLTLVACVFTNNVDAQDKSSQGEVQLGDPSLTAGIPGKGPLTDVQISKWINNPENHVPLNFTLPLGMAAGKGNVQGIENNPLTRAKIELGRQLFFDKRLSSDNTISCASCHQPEHGYAATTRFGVGVDGQMGDVNSPVAYNRILSSKQFWDGRAESLEDQAIGPIAAPIEMGNTHEQAVATIKGNDGYKKQFDTIYPNEGVTIGTIGKSIATFERTLVTGPSPFDFAEALKPYEDYDAEDFEDMQSDDSEEFARYTQLKADAAANPMSESAERGRELFFSDQGNCSACHVGANLTDERFHNIGIGMDASNPKMGRFSVTQDPEHKGVFKTPTIRNVASSPPYMHDGSLNTLEEVVEYYVKGGTPNAWLSKDVVKLNLSPQDKADLVAFMKACSGPLPQVNSERLPQ